MSMGYDVDDPRDAMIRENLAMGIYKGKAAPKPVKPGPRSVTVPAKPK